MEKATTPKPNKYAMFSLLVREEFLRRYKNNPSYSLRSYARQLNVDASLLSKIIRGQRKPSVELIKCVGPLIGIRPQQISKLLKGRDDVAYSRVSEDIFLVISDWFHFAILELMKTKGFESDPAWIAQRLSIHNAEAQSAVERLERLDFIEIKDGKYFLKARNNTWVNNEMTSAARKSLQKQLAMKAKDAIDNVPFEFRESGSLTIATPKNLIPDVKKKIQAFRREIDEYIESQESPDEVYQLVVSFYPLTKIIR